MMRGCWGCSGLVGVLVMVNRGRGGGARGLMGYDQRIKLASCLTGGVIYMILYESWL